MKLQLENEKNMAVWNTVHESEQRPVAVWRDRVGTGLMLLQAVGAFFSFIGSISSVMAANHTTLVVESWRMFGFIVFTTLFLLLAFWPRRYPGIWELIIMHKAALAITGIIVLGQGVQDAQTVLIFDGSLAVLTAIAYVLTKGYTGWSKLRTSSSRSV